MYRDKFGLKIATVRWLNAIGEHQHLFPVRKFVPTMVLFALHGIDLEVYGSGRQTIDPIDAKDMARFTVHACRQGTGNKVVDLGSGVAWSVNDSAELILETVKSVVGSTSSIRHVPMRPGEGDDINLKADMAYWHAQGLRTEVSFEDSVKTVVKYVLSVPEYAQMNALRFYGYQPRRSSVLV
jgi:nucleoside-diphosphate-sugar epimerase